MNNYKLGSLFDGSGGFPLAGTLCGIEPVWAAEVEPYPIAVTRARFPDMKHLGDISKVNGAEIEPVDIITFGSPCQDLSVAGKRAGLKHTENGDEETTRSGLFMEAVRIIKEMRKATNGKYPTFALWENVPGAFSSNKGEDFRIVCEELIKIVEPTATMPGVPQKGWNYADSYVGDGWSLAYRVLDAQYWGVPQRRRRIYLVADFRGQRARQVLFEREGLRGYFTQGRTPWQTTPSDAQGSPGADDREGEGFDGYNGDLTGDKSATLGVNCGLSTGRNGVIERGDGGLDDVAYTLKIRSGCEGGGKGALVQKNKSATLSCNNDQTLFQPINGAVTLEPGIAQREGGHIYEGVSGTLRANAGDNQMAVAYSVENHPADSRVNLDESGKVQTLTSRMGTGGGNVPMVMEPFCKSSRAKSADDATTWKHAKVANTLNTFDLGETRANELIVQESPVICLQGNGIDRADNAGCNGKGWKEDTAYTLNTIDRPAVAYGLDRASFNQGQNAKFDFTITEENQPTLTARGPGAVCCTTGGFTQVTEEVTPTLMARDYKDPTCVAYWDGGQTVGTLTANNAGGNQRMPDKENFNCVIEHKPNYIVRRLTPTECARLQGFADCHGHLEEKKFLTDKEYEFWQEARKTHATINGKTTRLYSRKQMLTWYNNLWTDAAEYKMWGNGIALPTALYAIQGIADALNNEEPEIEDWML